MTNRPALLKQSDLTRYAKAMRKADVSEWRVDVKPDGTVSIIVGKMDDTGRPNPCDRLLE